MSMLQTAVRCWISTGRQLRDYYPLNQWFDNCRAVDGWHSTRGLLWIKVYNSLNSITSSQLRSNEGRMCVVTYMIHGCIYSPTESIYTLIAHCQRPLEMSMYTTASATSSGSPG
jgi:hypothetical protein